jgi:hypothetical protein
MILFLFGVSCGALIPALLLMRRYKITFAELLDELTRRTR